ncbi:molybdenum cofactor biosynthesis protein B [Candidatus Latescibacterota bacterium]
MSHQEHRDAAPESVGVAVITISDTRDPTTDESGQLIKELLAEKGHEIVFYAIVRDSPRQIKGELAILGERSSCRAIILNGGTGIAPRDTTFDALTGILDKRLDGFGEIFRYLSYQEIGAAAIMSRALAGVYRGRIVISLPGSTNAVRLGMEKLVLPELAHMVGTISPRL